MDGGRSITFCATMEKVDAVQADNGTMKNLMQSKHGTGGLMRLIDADAFLKRSEEYTDCEFIHPKYQNTLREIVDDEPTIPAPRWVRCEERLPDDGFIGKLVCDDEGQMSICHGFATVTLANGKVVYTDSRIFDVFGEDTDLWDDVTHFTHWMPIEPPREDV